MKMKIFRFEITYLNEECKDNIKEVGFVWGDSYAEAVENLSIYTQEECIIEIKLYEIESYINGTILLDDIIASIMYKYDDSEKERLK